jgi:hypothetical protein
MLCLRDPANPTNDLGRNGASIKHVQATCTHLMNLLHDALQVNPANTKISVLKDIVGPAYSTPEPPVMYDSRIRQLIRYAENLENGEGDEALGQSNAFHNSVFKKGTLIRYTFRPAKERPSKQKQNNPGAGTFARKLQEQRKRRPRQTQRPEQRPKQRSQKQISISS